MQRQRIYYRRGAYELPENFLRVKRFQVNSDLSWSEIARRVGTCPQTMKR